MSRMIDGENVKALTETLQKGLEERMSAQEWETALLPSIALSLAQIADLMIERYKEVGDNNG